MIHYRYYAGCAKNQGILQIQDLCKDGNPPFHQTSWLLLSGATDPPKDISISKRRQRDIHGNKSGSFLAGLTKDFANMEGKIIKERGQLHNVVRNLRLKKSFALDEIRDHFEHCKRENLKPALYYAGHGEIGTGNWCFDDGTLSIQEISDMVRCECQLPVIVSDCCFSGHWANFCLNKGMKGFHCFAACPFDTMANDIDGTSYRI